MGPQILMLDPEGAPMEWKNPTTGEVTRGYDPTVRDTMGNVVGDPTGQTLSTLFFDHDDDGDPDLWIADDGDTLKVYRNDSLDGEIKFTPIESEMGIDNVGAWMSFAVGDYDGDGDLDIFFRNDNSGQNVVWLLQDGQKDSGGQVGSLNRTALYY